MELAGVCKLSVLVVIAPFSFTPVSRASWLPACAGSAWFRVRRCRTHQTVPLGGSQQDVEGRCIGLGTYQAKSNTSGAPAPTAIPTLAETGRSVLYGGLPVVGIVGAGFDDCVELGFWPLVPVGAIGWPSVPVAWIG